jgi:hypothetical protein
MGFKNFRGCLDIPADTVQAKRHHRSALYYKMFPQTLFLYKTSQSRLRKNPQQQFSSWVRNGKEKE